MEDLTEEPELEEREEEDEEEEEDDETKQKPKTDESKDQPQEQQQREEEEDESNDQDDELLVRPVRNSARRASLTDELNQADSQGLLETNFSVTGLNEIKTECITNNAAKSTPKRPMSLDLSAPMKFKKSRGTIRPEKVTARLIDQRLVRK